MTPSKLSIQRARRWGAVLAAGLVATAIGTATPLPAQAATADAKAAPLPSPKWPFVAAAASKPKDQGQGGIGAVLEGKADGVYVQQVVPGGPAHRAGVQPGDQFVRIDSYVVPPGAKVPQVVEHVRGAVGTTAEIEFRRQGQAVVLKLERMAMERMFPPPSKAPLLAKQGAAYLAQGGKQTLGIAFDSDLRVGESATYRWAVQAGSGALGSPGGQQGTGMVTVDPREGATLQLSDWKVELKSRADGTVLVSASNLPVHEVAGDWLQIAPPFPSVVKPRTESTKRSVRWQGASQLKFQLMMAGKPLAATRVTLRLTDAAGLSQDSQTALTDKAGIFEVAAPQGVYRIAGLQPSVAGAGVDAYFAADLAFPADRLVQTGDSKATVLEATAKAAPAAPAAPLDWATDPRVGQGLPEIAVQRWFGLDKPPASLAGKVLLIDVWATWCGPCRATAPQVAELHARLASKGLLVVAASIDKDEQALEEFVREQLPGGPAIAWVGPDAMEVLDTESVPTFLVVDGQGRIRGAHKGTGWTVPAAQSWLEGLLAEGKAKK